jgi:ferredoxin
VIEVQTKPYEADWTNPFYRYDPDQCILCGRCVEACQNVEVNETLSIRWEDTHPRVLSDGGNDDRRIKLRVVRSWRVHSTDTFGFSELVFGVSHLLGFSYAPRFKNLKRQRLYHALKAFGQIPKSLFILRLIDDPALRPAIEKQLDRIEHVHRFTRAVSVGNPREFLQAEKEEQEMAEACKRLIKNCIICWNYLYLSQKLEDSEDTISREAFLEAVANGSAVSWQHIKLIGNFVEDL